MRQHGIIASWNDDKGFGFIAPRAGGPEIFVHISSFPRGRRRPVVNDPVTYSVSRDQQNRLRAEGVVYEGGAKHQAARPRSIVPALCLLVGFFAFLLVLAVESVIPYSVVGFYAVMSAVCFFMYALDKSAARRRAWRIAESTLHFIELAGGWPGALIAQRLFRHKTKKKSFQLAFWFTVVANCAGLYWLLDSETAVGLRVSLGFG